MKQVSSVRPDIRTPESLALSALLAVLFSKKLITPEEYSAAIDAAFVQCAVAEEIRDAKEKESASADQSVSDPA